MMNRPDRFNTYLLLAALAAGVCACQTKAEKEKKKEPPKPYSTVYVHMETKGPVTDRSQPVPIYRAHPVTIYTEKQAFLDGRDVAKAALVEELGGFGLRIEFDRQGKLLLEQYTAANPGRRLAVFAQFPCPTNTTLVESRWLGAPRIPRRISDGVLVFTPDASREETAELVLGLNNLARRNHDSP